MLKSENSGGGQLNHLVTSDGVPLLVRNWKGHKDANTVFIGHTQPTHSGHFLDLANAFHKLGWNVNSGDLRAHGHSTSQGLKLAHLDSDKGWGQLIDDMELLLSNAFEGVSFEQRVIAVQNISALLTLEILKRNPRLARYIVISLPANQRVTAFLSRAFARARLKFRAADRPDEHTLHHLYTFSGAKLKNKKHLGDVMSADRDRVKAIVEDPLGFPTPTLGYWASIFQGYDEAWNWPDVSRIDPEVEFLLMNGSEDFLSDCGNAKPAADWLRKAGAQKISFSRLEGGRTAIFLDEDTFGISGLIDNWVRNGAIKENPCLQKHTGFDTSARSDNSKLVDSLVNVDPLDSDELIALCYEAINDETRWVELMNHLTMAIAKKNDAGLDEFEENLLSLMPHWDRSYKINRQLMSNAVLGVMLQNVIEKLDIGTALLANDQTVIYSNRAFATTLTHLEDDNSISGDQTISNRLRSSMTEEFSTSVASGDKEAVLVCNGHPVGFYFRPDAVRLAGQNEKDPAGLLILRCQADAVTSKSGSRVSMMELAYGLTTQEAAVALEVANGMGPAAIAKRLEVSVNTIRTHLRRGYEKMGVEGQTEMAARIMGGPIGWLNT